MDPTDTDGLLSGKSSLYRIELIVLVSLVLIYGQGTFQRNYIWKNNVSLWSDVVKKSPSKARAYEYLGLAYHQNGDLDSAIQQYIKGLSLAPCSADLHNNIGISYFEKGMTDLAIQHFKTAVELNPVHADAHYNLGVAYGNKGLFELANEEMRKGMALGRR